jgi:hypothetical protein
VAAGDYPQSGNDSASQTAGAKTKSFYVTSSKKEPDKTILKTTCLVSIIISGVDEQLRIIILAVIQLGRKPVICSTRYHFESQ